MPSRGVLALLALAAGIALLSGCGGSGNEDSRWINEVVLVSGKFEKENEAAKKTIATATSAPELEDAYAEYAAALREQAKRLAAIETPDECKDERDAMLGFVAKTATITDQLSEQETLTRSEFNDLRRQTSEAAKGFLNEFLPLAKTEEC